MRTEYDELEVIADFLNTHDKRMRFEGDTGVEHLQNPRYLYTWLLKHQLISEQDDTSEQDLELALRLRTGVRAAILNHTHDDDIEENKVKLLNDVVQSFHFSVVFEEETAYLKPDHTGGRKGLAALISVIFELKRKELWHRLRICSAEDCQWVFVDRSRPGTGKWCSMKACGNRAKNKTFRQRHRSFNSGNK